MVLQNDFKGYACSEELNKIPLAFRKYNNSISQKVIMDLIQDGKISKQDIAICQKVFQFRYVTVDRLLQSFPTLNYNSLRNKLEKLVEKCILNKFTYTSDGVEQKEAFRENSCQIYCCDYGAICILENIFNLFYGDFVVPKINIVSPTLTFNRLLLVDIFNAITSHIDPKRFSGFDFNPTDFSLGNKRIGRIEFTTNIKTADDQDIIFIGDIIREEDLSTTFSKKMRNLELIYNSDIQKKLVNLFNLSKSRNQVSEDKLITILVCENETVLERVINYISNDNKVINNLRFIMFDEKGIKDFESGIMYKWNTLHNKVVKVRTPLW